MKPGSVHLVGEPSSRGHTVVFEYVGRTSDEIRNLHRSGRRVRVVKDGSVVFPDVRSAGYKDRSGTNYIGLALFIGAPLIGGPRREFLSCARIR